jgi:hypothetical protein
MAFLHAPGTFHSKEMLVRPEDVCGKSIRPAQATIARFVNLLGGASVQVPAPEARDALAKGAADAITLPYAKSLPMTLVMGGLKRLELLKSKPELRENLWKIVNAMQGGLKERGFFLGNTNSPVTPVLFKGGVGEAANMAMDLRENFNIFCSVVIYPVVPKDVIMFRIIPTAAHTLDDVEETLTAFSALKVNLDGGFYFKEELVSVTKNV